MEYSMQYNSVRNRKDKEGKSRSGHTPDSGKVYGRNSRAIDRRSADRDGKACRKDSLSQKITSQLRVRFPAEIPASMIGRSFFAYFIDRQRSSVDEQHHGRFTELRIASGKFILTDPPDPDHPGLPDVSRSMLHARLIRSRLRQEPIASDCFAVFYRFSINFFIVFRIVKYRIFIHMPVDFLCSRSICILQHRGHGIYSRRIRGFLKTLTPCMGTAE